VERDERILLAARELFHERGFEAVGVDDIGAKAGTGPRSTGTSPASRNCFVTLFDRALVTSVTWATINMLVSVGTWPAEARGGEGFVDLLADLTLGGLHALEHADEIRKVA
jgi:hypothetical protein